MKRLTVIAVRGEKSKDSNETTTSFTLEGDQFRYSKRSTRGRRAPQPVSSTFAVTDEDRQKIAQILKESGLRDLPPHVDTQRKSPGTYHTLSIQYEGSDGTWSWAV